MYKLILMHDLEYLTGYSYPQAIREYTTTIKGVFEWHENYIITKRLRVYLHLSSTKDMNVENHFKGIFFFHFLNGSLAGVAFP